MKKHIVGIDLGTSFSSIAWIGKDDRVEVLKDAEGDPLMPSAVYIGTDGSTLVGKPALAAGAEDPLGLCVETKRLMSNPHRRWSLRNIELTPVDVAGILLRQLKQDFEAQVGTIDRAIVTVPVHYGTFERELVQEAARQAGLGAIDLVNEPIAAALAYILKDADLAYLTIASAQNILVFDLGGGTFDLGMVSYGNMNIKVVAQQSNPQLGGADWNRRLEQQIHDLAELEYGVRLRNHAKTWRSLEQWVEKTKRDFSEADPKPAAWSVKIKGKSVRFPITSAGFETLCHDLADQALRLSEEFIDKAPAETVDYRLLTVGGSTRMPMIKRILQGLVPDNRWLKFNVAPDLAVVHGAALFTRLWKGAKAPRAVPRAEAAPTETPPAAPVRAEPVATPAKPPRKARLIPASSRSLGIAIHVPGKGMTNRVLIARGAALPARKTTYVYPAERNPERVLVRVLEGDNEDLGQCVMLCSCIVSELPQRLSKETLLSVTLLLNESNFLEVIVRHKWHDEWRRVAQVRHRWSKLPDNSAP